MTDIDVILAGEPVEAMEAAKRLAAQNNPHHIPTLVAIAANKGLPMWPRIAALWTLGLTDDDRVSVPALKRIIADEKEGEQIKDYANEALDHLGDDDHIGDDDG